MRRALAVIAALFFCSASAVAAEGPWIKKEGVALRLIAVAPAANGEIAYGLQVRPERGWKFFWRSPGAFGIAPTFDAAGSTNVASATVLWPAPKRLTLVKGSPETAIGYDREVVLPVVVRPVHISDPVELRLTMEYGVCGEICIGDKVELALRPSLLAVDQVAALIDRHRTLVPRPAPANAIRVQRDGSTLVVRLTSPIRLDAPDLYVDAGPGRHFGAPKVTVNADRRGATFRVPLEQTMPDAPPDGCRLTVVVSDRSGSYEATVSVD
jgi:DsbC/DsbD-like thiol-disulfide interchange protein